MVKSLRRVLLGRKPAPRNLASGDGQPSPPPVVDSGEMPFLDHLEELRWRLIWGMGSMAVVVVICFFFADWIVDVLLIGPKKPSFITYQLLGMEAKEFALQNRTITGQFFAWAGTVITAGVILGAPFLIYHLWKFIEPALYPDEREGMRFASAGATLCFMAGIAFGYLIVTPLSLQFFANFELSAEISNEFDITKYFSMVAMWSLGVGILFELPVVIYFLAKAGILTSDMLRKGRRIAIVIIMILGAIITPPDPISQLIVALPLFGLYEVATLLAARVERKRAKALARAAKMETTA